MIFCIFLCLDYKSDRISFRKLMFSYRISHRKLLQVIKLVIENDCGSHRISYSKRAAGNTGRAERIEYMIYTDVQLKEKITCLINEFESEVVEFKEAKTNYSFNEIGKYFSALSNEANIRGFQEAWLVFGISNDKKFTGTEFRKQGGLQNLKKELVNGTNERLTFLEIYEVYMHKCRIIAFQIPPAIRGIPTTWQGAAYAREHESVCPLPMNKVDLIRSQIGMDWSKEIVKEASLDDLDPTAVQKARELFSKRQSDRRKAQEILSQLSDVEVLNKAGITIKGEITRTALLLLGKSEASYFFDGFIKDKLYMSF